MRERDAIGQVVGEAADGLRQGRLLAPGEVAGLGVLPDEQVQLQPGHRREEPRMPGGRALRTGRQIATAPAAWPAEPHGEDGKRIGVVKRLPVDAQPFPEVIAGVVLPGHARLVHLRARRLPDDHDARAGTCPEDRPWAMGQVPCAQHTSPGLGEDRGQLHRTSASKAWVSPACQPRQRSTSSAEPLTMGAPYSLFRRRRCRSARRRLPFFSSLEIRQGSGCDEVCRFVPGRPPFQVTRARTWKRGSR